MTLTNSSHFTATSTSDYFIHEVTVTSDLVDYSRGGSLNGIALFSLCLLSCVVIMTNSLLLLVFVKSPLLRTNTNAFIVSLAVSDSIVGLILLPVSASLIPYHPRLISNSVCHLLGFLTELRKNSTVHCLMAVTIDRCVAVTWPLRYTYIITKLSVAVLLVSVWTLSFVFALLPIFGWGHYRYFYWKITCVLDWQANVGFTVCTYILFALVPFVVMVILFMFIVKSAFVHRRTSLMFNMPVAGLAIAMGVNPVINYRRTTLQAMKTLFFIVAALIVLWTPSHVLDIWFYRDNRTTVLSRAATTVCTLLSYLSSAVNPIVFVTNRKYRQRLAELLCKSRCRKRRVAPDEQGCHTRHTSTTHLPDLAQSSYEAVSVIQGSPVRTVYINTKANTLNVPTFAPGIPLRPRPLSASPTISDGAKSPLNIPAILVTTDGDDGGSDWLAPNVVDRGETSANHSVTIHVPKPKCNLSTI